MKLPSHVASCHLQVVVFIGAPQFLEEQPACTHKKAPESKGHDDS
jgi:hypothetical protein